MSVWIPIIVMFAAFSPIVGLIVWTCKTGRYNRASYPNADEIGPAI